MRYLTGALKRKLTEKVLRAPGVFFFLDFDGTLAPIRPRPEMAALPVSIRGILARLSKNPRFSVGIISGRGLADLKARVKLKGVVYAGNHGLELEGPGFRYTHAKARESARILKEIADALRPLPKNYPGSFLEDKQLTLSYHYRLTDPARAESLRLDLLKRVFPWLKVGKISVMGAKKAVEIRPSLRWNKGSALRWILLHEDPASLPVCIGDDRTDESAFLSLKDRGVSVRVGFDGDSAARFYVKDCGEVADLLSLFAGSGRSRDDR